MEELLKMLGLKEGATEKDIINAVKALTAPVNKALELKDDATIDDAVKAIKALTSKKAGTPIASKEVLEVLELTEGATIEEVKSKVTALKGEPDKKLETELRALQEKIALKEAVELVDKYTKEGKLIPATREYDLKDAIRDQKAFTEKMEKSPVIVPQGAIADVEDPEHVTALTEDQKKVNEMLGVSEEDFKKHNK